MRPFQRHKGLIALTTVALAASALVASLAQTKVYRATAIVRVQSSTDRPAEMLIDLSALDYCDSSGLREFIRAAKLCAGNGTRLRVGGARGRVRRVFELTGIADVVGLEP